MILSRSFAFVLAAVAVFGAGPSLAQSWEVVEPAGDGARASICPLGEEGSADYLCFRLGCSALEPLHFTLDIAGRGAFPEPLEVAVGVDGGDVGGLTFAPHEMTGHTRLTAGFVPEDHEELVDLLQRGLRASLTLDLGGGTEEVPVGLTGSADSLYTVMQACPRPAPPAPPVSDPARLVLDEVSAACRDLGGDVTMEPGFERREDLDGDGREDLVIDYAAAACSQAAALNCTSGGCTVGFFLARDTGFTRMFADVIRGYEVYPGGFLALDLHGTACGLYGFEACRKVFDIAGAAPVLVEEIAGPEAEAMAVAGLAPAAVEATPAAVEPTEPTEPTAVVVAETEGVVVTPEGAAPPAEATAEAVVEATDAPVEPITITLDDTGVDPVPEVETATESDAGTDTEPVTEPVTVAIVMPEPAAPVPAAEAGSKDVIVVAAADEGTEEAPPAAAAAAAAADEDEGPRSRHMAGPAPAVPAEARFRGDGTLIRPEDEAE